MGRLSPLADIGKTVTVKFGNFARNDRFGGGYPSLNGRGCVKTLGTFAN